MINFSFPVGDKQFTAALNGNSFLAGVLGNDEAVIAPGAQSENNTNSSTADVPPANADEVENPGFSGGAMGLLMTVVIYGGLFFAIYFFLFRPQRKRDKQVKEMQSSLKVGDNVITSGGLYGKIVELGQEAHTIEFGSNRGIRVPVRISDILGIKTPVITPPHNKDVPIPDKEKEKTTSKE